MYKAPFTLAEFSPSSLINHNFQVDEETTEGDIGYDAIFGNILTLGLIMELEDRKMGWNGTVVLIRSLANKTPTAEVTSEHP